MWITDLQNILKTMPYDYYSSCCFNKIIAGYKTIILETDTFSLICYTDTGKWVKVYPDTWKNPEHKEEL
jgi:hypothetical protein